ncbi:DUF4432 family protein [Paenibacillus contaminans]|uniref:DUF4432 domain-containing protein n=1 Tax=Paenibacillus contaminans TaxID=450362 RepID=A0A329MLF2_9BACL|nr:DUF4432 family protein [Paenibacillus contaminans]RAV20689.1 hypothetical protein DQG23_14355 [Paenibacillus contaminans]
MGDSYRPYRNAGCRIIDDIIYKGYRSLLLENDKLLIHLLLDKGGEPVRWLHKPTDTDFIWHSHNGLGPPHPLYAEYEIGYLGGWQEMFPEVSYTSAYRGGTVHRGESAVTPWDYRIVKDEPKEIKVLLVNQIRSMPFRTEKLITLTAGSAVVRIEETVRNLSPSTELEANWGHHLAYGHPFLGKESFITLGEGAKVFHPVTGESWKWPVMRLDGADTDLSIMPDAGTSRDLLYLSVPDSRYRLTNASTGVSLEVRWDGNVWPYLWYWQNFQADMQYPFFGSDYNIGLEMFNVPPKLTLSEAVERGLALAVPPLGSITSWLEFEVCGSI